MALAGVAVLAGALGLTLASCGGGSAPFVDPHPLNDGGIPDRVVTEGGADRADGRGDSGQADDGGPTGDGATDAGTSDLATADGAADLTGTSDGGSDASSDAALVPTTVRVDVTDPNEGALQIASTRFSPMVSVVITTDLTRTDDIKQVDAELWSTGTLPARISSTRLAQLNKTGAGGRGGAGAGGAGGAGGLGTGGMSGGSGSGGAAGAGLGADDGGASDAPSDRSRDLLFAFGDTPIDLSSVTTATYELRVFATTLAGVTASATRTVRIDAGPVIRVIAPTIDQAARGSIFVSVQVDDPFSSVPPTVNISVANQRITPLTIVGDLYQATVAETLTMPPLSGEQLLDVTAVNAAGVAARHASVRFIFDDVGPVITNGKPGTVELIGGIVKLEADISDPSGVDVNTVVAVVAHGGSSLEVRLDQDPDDHKHFSHLFDTRRLSNTVLYPTLSFRASDLPGNQSNIGYTVAVDNTPPLSELDPPADLRIRHYTNLNWRCSWPFDPLGVDAVSDGDYVLQVFDVRARVEDEGNTPVAGNADITPLAGLDPAHVELLVLDDTNRALLVDSDGDGICDAVNPKLVPTTTPMSSQDALLVNLAPVPTAGAADLTADPSILVEGFSDCTVGNDAIGPPLLCRTSDMTIAIPSRYNIKDPAVWSIPRVVPGTAQCVGNQFDSLGNQINDGPACLAVHAIDRLGNSQVSRVMHVCIDHDGDRAECPFAPLATVQGGTPVQITTAAPHGLITGARALVGGIPTLFDANGLWKVTVVSSTVFTLDGSSTPATTVMGGQFMPWTASSDCSGRQTSLNPVVVDDTTACRPWRRFSRGEHLDID